jgi:hypothetical protein
MRGDYDDDKVTVSTYHLKYETIAKNSFKESPDKSSPIKQLQQQSIVQRAPQSNLSLRP